VASFITLDVSWRYNLFDVLVFGDSEPSPLRTKLMVGTSEAFNQVDSTIPETMKTEAIESLTTTTPDSTSDMNLA
jgi:hypothetical protein